MDEKKALAKKAIIAGKTKAQFLAEHVGADLEEYAEAYNQMIAIPKAVTIGSQNFN